MTLTFERRHWVLFWILLGLQTLGFALTALKANVPIGWVYFLLAIVLTIVAPFVTTIVIVNLIDEIFGRAPRDRR